MNRPAVVATAIRNAAAIVLAVVIVCLIDGVEPRATWLLLPVLLIPLVMFVSGMAMILSSLFVRYRDVQPIWGVATQLIFYATPILYVVEYVPESLREPIMANPLASILEQARLWLVDPSAQGFADAIGGFPQLLVPIAILLGVFAFGLWIFNHEAPRIAERL